MDIQIIRSEVIGGYRSAKWLPGIGVSLVVLGFGFGVVDFVGSGLSVVGSSVPIK